MVFDVVARRIVPDALWELQRENGDFSPYFSSANLKPFKFTAHPSPQTEVGIR